MRNLSKYSAVNVNWLLMDMVGGMFDEMTIQAGLQLKTQGEGPQKGGVVNYEEGSGTHDWVTECRQLGVATTVMQSIFISVNALGSHFQYMQTLMSEFTGSSAMNAFFFEKNPIRSSWGITWWSRCWIMACCYWCNSIAKPYKTNPPSVQVLPFCPILQSSLTYSEIVYQFFAKWWSHHNLIMSGMQSCPTA